MSTTTADKTIADVLHEEGERMFQNSVAAGLAGDMEKGERLYERSRTARQMALVALTFPSQVDVDGVLEFLSWSPERLAFALRPRNAA